MFKKLRNRFIFTNMLTTTAILVFAFVLIFIFSAFLTKHEMPHAPRQFQEHSEFRDIFEKEIENERSNQLVRLGITLICVGIGVEVLVFIASYYFAEKSIKPVKEAYEKQRVFIANASHELKTPIAAIRANFEALDSKEQPWTDNIETELSRASNLVNDLLVLARTDGRTELAAKNDIDLSKLVNKRAQTIKARLDDKKLRMELSRGLIANISSADFSQVLDILLDNAVKYSSKEIIVRLKKGLLVVENDGRMIAKDKLDKIFDRFYQTDKTSEGAGLGLAIAKSISEQNGWKIWAESGNGITRFSVSF